MANEYQSELDRINQNIANTYSVLSEAGAATPTAANSENLAETAANIAAVLYNKDQGLSDTQKEQARTNIGALAESELDNAVNDALQQAKESGDFKGDPGTPGSNGKDGTSVTVSSVSESSADGGTNVVTFSDGKKLNVKNGSKGSDGSPGATGPTGAGVKSMTYNSSTNKWTVTLTDNSTITVDGPALFSGSWDDLTNKPSSFTPASHNHAAGDINSGTFDAARIPSLAASKISAGTFAGQVVAASSAQTPGTSLLRNSKMVTSESYPSNNGEINWMCE